MHIEAFSHFRKSAFCNITLHHNTAASGLWEEEFESSEGIGNRHDPFYMEVGSRTLSPFWARPIRPLLLRKRTNLADYKLQLFPCNGYDYPQRCNHGGIGPKVTMTGREGWFCACLCPAQWMGPQCSVYQPAGGRR